MTETVEARAREIALDALGWGPSPDLSVQIDKLIADGLNNRRGHMTTYMAGRFIDAYRAAHKALSAALSTRNEVIEEAARLADTAKLKSDAEVRLYDSYGGPELSGRRIEQVRAKAFEEIAAAIRELKEGER